MTLGAVLLCGCANVPRPRDSGASQTTCAPGSKTLDRADIAAVAQSHREDLQACYEESLRRDGRSAGKVVVLFSINPTGEVIDPGIEENSFATTRLVGCITEAVKRWQFPCTGLDAPQPVAYPFVFAVR